jgi:hypothetical protein
MCLFLSYVPTQYFLSFSVCYSVFLSVPFLFPAPAPLIYFLFAPFSQPHTLTLTSSAIFSTTFVLSVYFAFPRPLPPQMEHCRGRRTRQLWHHRGRTAHHQFRAIGRGDGAAARKKHALIENRQFTFEMTKCSFFKVSFL